MEIFVEDQDREDKMTTAQDIKNAFNRRVQEYDPAQIYYTGKMEGTIIGVLKKCCGSDDNYRQVLKALTGKTSSKDLSNAEWYALWKFVKPTKPEGGKWQSEHTDTQLNVLCNTLINGMPAQEETLVDFTMKLALGGSDE